MSLISKVLLFSIFVIGNIYADKFDGNEPHIYKTEIPTAPRNGMMGIASVAGISSQNDQVTSVAGVHFFPPLSNKIAVAIQNEKSSRQNKDSNENIIATSNPNTDWRRRSDGNIAEGSINVYPSGIVVSSSAQSGNSIGSYGNRNIGSYGNPWANAFNPMIWPMNDLYRGPSRNFNSHGDLDWIHKDIFNNYVPPNLYLKRTWLYPTFNPFIN